MKKMVLIFLVVIFLAPGGLRPSRAFFQPAAAEDAASILSSLEAAVENNPDDLRLGTNYRQAVIQTAQYDRGLKFFEKLAGEHPDSANVRLNYAFAYVDKIPAAGSITQVLLANSALTQFTKSIELKPSWIGYYSRGNSYMFWPKIFGRTPLGIADLEEAIKLQKADKKRIYHVRTYIALGDGYWKLDELDKAKGAWSEGLAQFPDNAALKARLAKQGDELKALIEDTYDVTKRVDTSLSELWADQGADRK
jgi:tetratricopeptide (TPR) repeat protein